MKDAPPYFFVNQVDVSSIVVAATYRQSMSHPAPAQAAFSAVFRRTMGVSPGRYRLEATR